MQKYAIMPKYFFRKHLLILTCDVEKDDDVHVQRSGCRVGGGVAQFGQGSQRRGCRVRVRVARKWSQSLCGGCEKRKECHRNQYFVTSTLQLPPILCDCSFATPIDTLRPLLSHTHWNFATSFLQPPPPFRNLQPATSTSFLLPFGYYIYQFYDTSS